MPLIVLECKGIPATRRERIEGAVEAGGRHAAADPFRGGVRVVITGPQGFERTVFVDRGHADRLRDACEAVALRLGGWEEKAEKVYT